MKIFLCGGGAGKQTIEAIRKFNNVIDHTKPLLYVPLAMKSELYPSCLEWIKGEMREADVPSIDMVTSADEIVKKDLSNYSAIFIGGGNTFKLLYELKISGAFDRIKDYIEQDGVIFGASAGAIIFGESLEACALDDANDVNLRDITGFDVLNGVSLLCHYTNHTEERDRKNTTYLTELSKRLRVIALPEEVTLFVNGNNVEVIGTKPFYYFENGVREELYKYNQKFHRIIGKEFYSIFRVIDMLCLNIGHDIEVELSGRMGIRKEMRPEYSFHIQTQWRFIRNGSIILASRDIYKPFSENVSDDWDYDKFGRCDEESSVFDVLSKGVNDTLKGCTVIDCSYNSLGDLKVIFSDGTFFETFTPSCRKAEFWRLIDFAEREHIVIFEED